MKKYIFKGIEVESGSHSHPFFQEVVIINDNIAVYNNCLYAITTKTITIDGVVFTLEEKNNNN